MFIYSIGVKLYFIFCKILFFMSVKFGMIFDLKSIKLLGVIIDDAL